MFFMKRQLGAAARHGLNGFAAGIMTAASVWSLLIPAIDQSADLSVPAFLPAVIGFWVGILFIPLTDRLLGFPASDGTALMAAAVTMHNIPEGMAVGVLFAGVLGGADITMAEAMVLSAGIAIQNFPEGAIISMPLHAAGMGRGKSFLYGVLSGAVEPVAAVLTIFVSWLIVPLMPYLLSFAAGAMIYVVAEELIPQADSDGHLGTIAFAFGFTVMMMLDVSMG